MSFFENVYTVVKTIPKGNVASYGQVAKLAGNPRASRIVGFALHNNPDPSIIPCHRVVFADGRLSPAFAFGGIIRHQELLEKEGVAIKNHRVNMKEYQVSW